MPDCMAEKMGKAFIAMNKFKIFILPIVILLLNNSCSDKAKTIDTYSDFFTPVYVNYTVNLTLPSAIPLNATGGWIYINGIGNKGVLVYRYFDEFYAFDRTCPYKPDSACSMVSVDSSNAYIRCGQYSGSFKKCCDSEFFIQNGSVRKGPAARPLKSYYTKLDGQTLYISSSPQF